MAKDQVGELGLDVKDIMDALGQVNKSLDKLAKHAEAADKKIKGGFTDSLKGAARALGIAFGATAIARYITNLRNLGSELDDIRKKRIAGSEAGGAADNDAKRGAGPAEVFRSFGIGFDRFATQVKLFTAEAITGLLMAAEDATNAIAAKFGGKQSHMMRDILKAGKEREAAAAPVYKIEDDIANFLQEGVVSYQEQVDLLGRQLELSKYKLKVAQLDTQEGRDAANAAKVQIGQQETALENLRIEKERSLAAARTETREMALLTAGQKGAAKEEEIRLKYNLKIAQAIRDGRDDLAGQLKIQRQMDLNANAVAEHNMTPKERADERRAARKYSRDLEKTKKHEEDLEARRKQATGEQADPAKHMSGPQHMDPDQFKPKLGKRDVIPGDFMAGGRPPGDFKGTPGSELDRYRQRRKTAANAANDAAGIKTDSPAAQKFYNEGIKELQAISKNTQGMFQNKP